MTNRPDQHEPLDAEERDLAARLGRAGPTDGPSPALDARILAAAHAAATTHRPRRHGRLAWLGLPPALVTGVGVAAAAVLALGLVWQLRPQYGGISAQQEAGADEEVIIMAEPSGAASAPAANPPPLEQPAAPAPVARAQTDKPNATADAAAPASANTASASSPMSVDERGRVAAQAAAAEAKRETDAAADSAALADDGFTPEPAEAAAQAPARKSHATYTTAARATAERRERARIAAAALPAAAPAAPPAAAPAASAPAAASPPASAVAEAEDTTLDRIEVTGSRIRRSDIDWSQVPVSEDRHLAAAEWLERIRDRRDADDLDNARASLRLFRRYHPRTRVPNDLRALLATDARR